MRSLYRTLSLRYLQQRWLRALLVVASIAPGVGLLVATRALNASMSLAARTAATPLAGGADLYVTNGDSGVPRRLTAMLERIPGVSAVEPLVIGRVRLPDLGDHRQAQLLGIVWRAAQADGNPWGVQIDWTIAPDSVPALKGADPQDLLSKLKRFGLRPVLVGDQLAAELTTVPMDARLDRVFQWMNKDVAEKLKTAMVRIQPVGEAPHTFIKVGTVRAEGPAEDFVKNALIMNGADAADLLARPDLLSRIDLWLEPGADLDEVRGRIKDAVAGQAAVRTPGENDQRVQEMMAGLQLGFSLSGAGALVVGLFLVYMALSVSVAERRHEIGILRSLGATRHQVWELFAGEALFLGVAGAALGIPLGLSLAQYVGLDFIQRLLSDFFFAMEARRVQITADTVLIPALAGVATALLAGLTPAIRAAQEEPASAVRRLPPTTGLRQRIWQPVISCVLLAFGAAGMVLRAHLPPRWGTYGGFILILLGMLLTMPFLAAATARLLQPVVRWFVGVEGRLAADNLVRAPARTGLVITALAAGVTMFVQTAGVIRSNQDPILDWIDQTLDADLFVTSGSPMTGTGQNLLLQADLGRAIEEAIPDVEAALPVRSRQADFGDNMVFLIAVDATGFAAADRHEGPLLNRDMYGRLRKPGTAVISQNFAALYHVKVGDAISLRGPHGPVKLRVVGAIEDYSFNRGTVMMDKKTYEQSFDDPLVDAYYVYLRRGANRDAVRGELLRRWEAEHALVVLKREEVREHFMQTIHRFAAVAYAQEIVVGIVAAVGVITALMISVLQRRRELGILRAVGATRSQVLRSVLAEAILMGVIGTLIGLVVGIPVEWYIVQVVLFEETGLLFPVSIPWLEAGMIAGAGLLIATIAGLGPALRTLRLRIPEAIAYE